jgi:hypothetical protein
MLTISSNIKESRDKTRNDQRPLTALMKTFRYHTLVETQLKKA